MPEKLPVVYRFIRNEVLAVFPTSDASYGRLSCYAHIGQHFEADSNYARSGRLATEAEYRDLHSELTRIYAPEYALVIRKRIHA